MKKLLLLSVSTVFAGVLAAQSIPDGTFEFWNTTTWNDPVYYNTSNDQGVPNGLPANVTQTTGYHGTYGVKLETVGTLSKAQAGFIINGNPNNNSITGGIPYSQEPTGVRFYYQYTPVSGDVAAVLVIFKKLGSPIDSFLITLPVAENSYTLHSYYKNVSNFPIAPDTVVFGAVSSLAALTSGGGNPGSTLIIDSVTFTGVSSQPTDMNGDFENWTSDTLLTPSQWYINYPNVTRTTNAASGHYAMELETENTPGNGVQQGQAGTGYYPNCNGLCYELGGDPYALTASGKDTLEFDYKYAPKPNDTANVSLSFIKNGQTVYSSGISFFSTTSAYTYTTVPFDLNGVSPVPDTVIVNVTSSSHNHDTTSSQYAPYVGSIFKIDNLTFASQKKSLGINAISATEGIHVYPVPAKNQINVDLTNLSGSLEKISIYDMSGRLLSTQSYFGGVRNTVETIDVSSFSTGIYLIEATTNNGKFYQKVVKE